VIDESVPVHIEVLLPAFVLGCVMAYPGRAGGGGTEASDPHGEIETPGEKRVGAIVAAVFMILVGLSMPMVLSGEAAGRGGAMAEAEEPTLRGAGVPVAEATAAEIGRGLEVGRVTAAQPPMGWGSIALHVLLVTLIANLGKMFPALCYRREAHWRERLAIAIGMWPRGEVGAGVLVISMSYGIGGPIVTIAMLSLALNLLLTGAFIYVAQRLTAPLPAYGRLGAATAPD
jgi:hypothetical protein